mgnify:CR=1 FL=1|jgi:hypothetical protein
MNSPFGRVLKPPQIWATMAGRPTKDRGRTIKKRLHMQAFLK